ncbi:MAG: N-acetylmuramoyl-L-alanine amidase [Clostridiales bacterium]|nr:N-acetylmuramoyl-L-alanine amidase [Candidatus Crickella caballi]
MQLTDEEIRAILIEQKKRKRRKQRIKRRIVSAILLILVLVVGIEIFINRDAANEPRGVIFIDAGHGGVDGGSSVGDRMEKNDTLTLALNVKKALENQDFKVVLSRSDDSDVDRGERGKMANECNAALMVSIHRNKATEGNGVEVYIPSSNGKESQLLGNNVMKSLVAVGFAERQVRAGTLVTPNDDYLENSVSSMPSCLVEVGFLQDKGDNELFDNKQKEIAGAIAEAISNTYESLFEQTEEE